MTEFFFRTPFAETGDKTAIPNDTQPSGDVSYTEGWTPDYELEVGVDPSAKPIDRQKHNDIFNKLTGAVGFLQSHGVAEWISAADNGGVDYPYDLYARVLYIDGAIYQSVVAANTETPGTGTQWVNVSTTPVAQGYINGFITSNGTDADHDIDFAAGIARSSDNTTNMETVSVITKQIDANWAEGDNVGGFPDTINLTNDTWYRMFAISKPNGDTDFGFDNSSSAANLLDGTNAGGAGYNKYRQIGWVRYATATILAYSQQGDNFTLDVPIQDFSGSIPAAKTNLSLTVPPDTEAVIDLNMESTVVSTTCFALITKTIQFDSVPSQTLYHFRAFTSADGDNNDASGEFYRFVNSSSQISHRSSTVNNSADYNTVGWNDTRGKQ